MKKLVVAASAVFLSGSAVAGILPNASGADAAVVQSASAMAPNMMLTPKDPSLPPMEMNAATPADAGGKPGGIAMQHPQMDQGVGGPDESEEPRTYPRCRSRSDDRCQQGS